MFHLYGFSTQNTLKVLYVLAELDAEFEFHFVDLGKGENRSEEFRSRTPVGKVPLLEHDGRTLFESGAICRYVANVSESPLYPEGKMDRAQVDQWIDYFTCHAGRSLTTLFYEQVIKPKYGLGDPDAAKVAEAVEMATSSLKAVERHLKSNDFLANNALSIADLFAFAYVEQCRDIDFSLDKLPAVTAWKNRIESRGSIARARSVLPA